MRRRCASKIVVSIKEINYFDISPRSNTFQTQALQKHRPICLEEPADCTSINVSQCDFRVPLCTLVVKFSNLFLFQLIRIRLYDFNHQMMVYMNSVLIMKNARNRS